MTKTIKELLPQAVVSAETQALTTRDAPANTPALLSQAKLTFPNFQTFNDPTLERAAIAAFQFVDAMVSQERPSWLSFVGNSGTGKTFLAKEIYKVAMGCGWLTAISHSPRAVLSPVRKVFWPLLTTKLRDGEYWLVDELADCNFVFIDEIAVEHDPSGFARDKLCEILSRRVGKWTVLTSNLTLEKLAEIDQRIASRMIRDGSIAVEMDTQDYALRREPETAKVKTPDEVLRETSSVGKSP